MKQLRTAVLAGCMLLSATTAQSEMLLGVYYGNQGWAMDDVSALEAWQNKKNAVVNLYTGWTEQSRDLLFNYQLDNIWANGNIPMVSWEPHLSGSTPNNIETSIAQGDYDAYVLSWAGRMKTFLAGLDGVLGTKDDRRAYIRLAHEMNGDWYPWSAEAGANDPADYIAMWQRVHGQLSELGLGKSHLQWVWAVNASDSGAFSAESYYPGDDYVDWLGIDGFNWGAEYSWSYWRTPMDIFEGMRLRLKALAPGKPLALPEVATTSKQVYGNDPAAKNLWIQQLSDYAEMSDIRLISWFNEDKEADWQMFGGEHGAESLAGVYTYPAYQALAGGNSVVGGTDSLRVLSDAQFQGQLDSPASNLPAKQCQLNYTISQRWVGGYVANITAQANFLIPKDWSIKWTFANQERLSYGWNADLSQQENTISVTPPSWWQWKPAGSEPSFGYVGLGTPAKPSAATLGGIACRIGG